MAKPSSLPRPARPPRWRLLLAAAVAVSLPQPALAKRERPAKPAAVIPTVELELRHQADAELSGVYAARGYRPLWLTSGGTIAPAGSQLIELIESASIDQLDPAALHLSELKDAVAVLQQDSSPGARARAELALSRAFVDYVRAIRRAPATGMTYEHQSLRPAVPDRDDALWAAASAPSLSDYLGQMRWMHPLYAQLRRAALAAEQSGEPDPAVLDNLARLRALPPMAKGRAILVDAASARLWMYEDGRPVDSMKVVVGKPETQTPLYAGYVRYAILNPYWNVPDNLVSDRIAANVLSRGPAYLRAARYEVLADWSSEPARLDPAKVDWRQVAAGANALRVRQLPGADNAMGKIKFEFPNPLGIYLHDTPEKHLMLKEQRQFSNGCVRLEDAERLGRWLFQGPLPSAGSEPEQRVDLPQIVPIYITYLTAHPVGGTIARGPDPYKRDIGARLAVASAEGNSNAVAR